MSSILTCQHCGCSEIDTDQARGDSVCTNCGSVLEENIIVSEIQFEETAHGGSAAIGQYVSSDGKSGAFRRGYNKESTAVTEQLGKKLITTMAVNLDLRPYHVDTAFNFFKMAVKMRFTRGRIRTHVCGACIYIVCRTDETPPPVMLLDISDLIQVNVYVLGHTYLALSNLFSLKIPPLDPSLYILRFAHKLELKDKIHEVAETAARLVQRMKRDWLNTGRRPSGLCGAALLVAARMYNFNRTTKNIIEIVKVCETTLKKRLTEFGETPSSHLTLDEFMTIDLEEEQDPPAFKAARIKAKLTAMEQQGYDKIESYQREIDKALDERKRKVRGRYAKYVKSDVQEEKEEADAMQFIADETIDSINLFLHGSEAGPNDGEVAGPSGEGIVKNVQGLKPTPESLGLTETIEECMKVNHEPVVQDDDGLLDLTGIDDEEIDCYIMNDCEVKIKTDMWNQLNAEYLKELKEKEARAAREKEENAGKPEKKKRKVARRQLGPSSTAGEAIEKMLHSKKLSNKINYDVLKNLSSETTNTGTPKDTDSKTPTMPTLQSTPLADKLAATIFKSPTSTTNVGKSRLQRLPSIVNGNLLKKSVESDDSSEANQQIFENIFNAQKKKLEEEKQVVDNDVVDGDDFPEDQDDFDKYEEEEETHISAAKLLGRTEDEYVYPEDDYYYECDDT